MIGLVLLELYVTNVGILKGEILAFLLRRHERVVLVHLFGGCLFSQYIDYCLRCLSIKLFLVTECFLAYNERVLR